MALFTKDWDLTPISNLFTMIVQANLAFATGKIANHHVNITFFIQAVLSE